MEKIRKIIHVDMDAFYASVEERDNPYLVGKPLAVGGIRERGVVAAANYEARKFGIHSAMPTVTALRKCSHLIIVKPRFEVYKEVSRQIRNIFFEYTDLVEPLSLDEAFLDVTENKVNISSATLIAEDIKRRIKRETSLTASAGVSVNKFLAKIASDYQKPNGLFVIKPEKTQEFVDNLEIKKFFGVGKVTLQKMHKHGIFKGADLKKKEKHELIKLFGKQGNYFYNIARAIDDRPVVPDRQRKSVGAERTFLHDLKSFSDMEREIIKISEETHKRLIKSKLSGKTITIKIKFSDFKQITRSKTVNNRIKKLEEIKLLSIELLKSVDLVGRKVRLFGVTISNLGDTITEYDGQLEIDF